MCFSVTYRIKDFGNFHDENLNCKVEDINVKISEVDCKMKLDT